MQGLILDEQQKITLSVNGVEFPLVAGDLEIFKKLVDFNYAENSIADNIFKLEGLVKEAVGQDCFSEIFKERKVTASDLLQISKYVIDAYTQHFMSVAEKYSPENLNTTDEHTVQQTSE